MVNIFLHLFSIHIFFLMKCLFRSLVHLVTRLVVSLLLSFEKFFNMFRIEVLSQIYSMCLRYTAWKQFQCHFQRTWHGLCKSLKEICFLKNYSFFKIVIKYTSHAFSHFSRFSVYSSVALSTITLLCRCRHHLPPGLFIFTHCNSMPVTY